MGLPSEEQTPHSLQRRRGSRGRNRRARHSEVPGWRDRPGRRPRDRRFRRHRPGFAAGQDRLHDLSTRVSSTPPSTKSAITYIDGDAGILRYRGYPIEQLAEKSTFIEVSYLLIYGELPTPDQLEEFTTRIQRHTLLHEDLKRFFDGFPRNAHPMPVLSSAVNALSAYYQDSLDPFDDEQVELSTIRLLAKLPTIAAYALQEVRRPAVPLPGQLADPGGELPADDVRVPRRALRGRPRARPGARHAADPARRPRAELLDVDGAAGRLVAGQPVHLDLRRHQRAVGPAARRRQPGGAGDAGEDPAEEATTSATFVKQGQEQGRRRQADGLRAPGLQELRPAGRASSRSRPTRSSASSAATTSCSTSPRSSKRSRSPTTYFIERKLYPNVDFYTGVIYRAMGFPTRMFTVLFALGRLPGWIAHWREMHRRGRQQDRPSAPDLHRLHRARLRRHRRAVDTPRDRRRASGRKLSLNAACRGTSSSSGPQPLAVKRL